MGPAAAFCGWAHSLAHLHPRRPANKQLTEEPPNAVPKDPRTARFGPIALRAREQRGGSAFCFGVRGGGLT